MSVWLPSAPCTPRGCATHHGPAAGYLTAAARLLAGIVTVLAGLLLGPLVALLAVVLGTRFRHLMTRCWARAVVRAFGVRIRVIGRPYAPRASLVVANHISWLDIPLIAASLPGRMLAKSEIRRWPVLGPLAARGGTLFLERDRLRTLPATVREMASALDGGARVIAFPEGSTWCGREQGRFRHAVFQAALDAGAAVQPVRIRYLPTGAAAFVGDDSLGASLWRVVAAGGLTAEIRLLPAIPAGSCPDRRSLARAAQLAVASDSANLPSVSVHQWVSSSSAAASSVRTPS
ncbi:1-acyl-sn-glycerol-3-phosphate acyltransferase [Streptomyces lunaelactis]|uniref:1-acyl-sn-glycerol-3-phosphate acyltransferase n=1 Tax=Streptomyces lunaelactis TaxID=1535768 RepID=A0A2R4TC50_9ACTN|nr:lysophospholipid acyltransferase family protein [Streptomyces lunaelactis]AVZ76661.1 1-acyl-sn-glycerol-3-phosphate acyltransferase [Streptomyces lunaelactis]NUJ99574.1 1-acyl-sn-glycerol-3-phosphate acyltransferase [Streptomyces lunaelactis]NUK14298.1 1-acyl-sn-glycerol-3-phosphate acyltransferase [Streptomyces lunaelactis]NUK35401.1 1-acyl-sn-glycerol-3-phosphate acyltransferase [Streptomyces lunaelactis]NUK42116.1 1-acyl-sn-glycerol-3-phosphate acyltransferase [Streptomyces lunaelactis]